eukprot:TRINITY_DN4682_c0_g1_i2.p2 TRINITY_DN4682_c0_g1~~TRINITY_DN4682_c0_g1_i2.p2  ORF type:complete len:512 (-),score=101.55 TRINITY_DN4682_c0_g1_i2:1089-2624(-)
MENYFQTHYITNESARQHGDTSKITLEQVLNITTTLCVMIASNKKWTSTQWTTISNKKKKRIQNQVFELNYVVYNRDNLPLISETWYDEWKKQSFDKVDKLKKNFVEDIVCPHLCLMPQSKTKKVPFEVFEYFKEKFFPEAQKILQSEDPCKICKEALNAENERDRHLRREKNTVRYDLSFLLSSRGNYFQGSMMYYIIPRDWLTLWRDYIDDEHHEIPFPGHPNNTHFICEHGKLSIDIPKELYNLTNTFSYKCKFFALDEYDWKKLCIKYPESGPKISFYVSAKNYTDCSWRYTVESSPEGCIECCKKLELEERKQKLNFVDKRISVKLDGIYNRKEEKVLCSHSTKLKELKLLIYQHFDIQPINQQLTCGDDTFLVDDEMTLREYDITEDSTIVVEKVKAPEVYVNDSTTSTTSRREKAFEGTKLLQGGGNVKPKEGDNKDTTQGDKDKEQIEIIDDLDDKFGYPKFGSTTTPVPVVHNPNEWSCKDCTYLNHIAFDNCEMCSSLKPT